MNENLIKFVFLFFVGNSILNFAIAVVARVKTKRPEFNLLIAYWPAVIFTFMVAGVLRNNPVQMAYSYFLQGFSSNLMVHILMSSLGLKTNWKLISLFQLATIGLSTFLLKETDVGFTLSLIPVCVSFSLPFIKPIWYVLVQNRADSNWVEKSMGVVFITAIIHHFNFAFFRLVPGTEAFGFACTIAEYQCMSILLPLMINHRREASEQTNIRQALERISGSQQDSTSTDELYQLLEFQIAQKELFVNQLHTSNLHLEDEREMNEMLIRTISHDLANPLTVISAYTEMLHTGKIPEKDQDKVWGRIKANTQSSLDMIGRIRHAILTRTQASLVSLNDVSVDQALKRTIELLEPRLKEKNITIRYENELFDLVRVKAEETALCEHVLANILSNALKFSYPGSEVVVSVTEQQDNVEVRVRDFGTGIKETRLEKRLLHTTPGTDGEIGTGFGLMVSGYFLRQFGALINITSSTEGPEKGTTVTVLLRKSQETQHLTSAWQENAILLN